MDSEKPIAQSGDLQIVHFKNVRFNELTARNQAELTALLHSVSGGQLEDSDLSRLLVDSTEYNAGELVCALLKAGADGSEVDEFGQTPLHHAASTGQLDCVKVLIENAKSSVNVKDGSGRIPLHCACECGEVGVVQVLIDADLQSVNAVDDLGATPLHLTARWGHLDVITALLKAGGKPMLRDYKGRSPLTIAKSLPNKKSRGVVELLRSQGFSKELFSLQRLSAICVLSAPNAFDPACLPCELVEYLQDL